jgi:hypothetical protein
MPCHPSRPALVLLALALTLQPLAAIACAPPSTAALSDFDADRMADFYRARSQGLGEALVAPSAEERALVSELFAAGDSFIDAIPDGDYRCRTIKLGGLLPLVAYGFFDCRISDGGTRIDKLTGSQRFSGSLATTETTLFYQGALHYGDEQPMDYGADPERDQVGCLYRVGEAPRRYRLELPRPQFESTHDVIELVRVK